MFRRLGAAVVNALPFEIALLDQEGTICWTNDAWRQSEGPAAGSSFLQLWDNDNAGTLQGIRAVLDAQQPTFVAEYPVRSLERGWRCAIFTSLKDRGVEGALVIQERTSTPFITSRCDPPPEHFGREQRIQAVGRLVGGVAHDFANLLTLIAGHSEILLHRMNAQDPLRPGLEEIRDAADRGSRLTAQLLGFSRGQAVTPKVLGLNSLVADMGSLLRPIIGEHIEFVTALISRPDTVKADPGQMEQLIMNLVLNARDAMPKGGRLTIQTSHVELDVLTARIHQVSPGPYVMLTVADTGEGIKGDVLPRLFEPFFTTKDKGKGTGVGLSTVRAIVRQHNAAIWVSSRPGQGSQFFICLPQAEETAGSKATPTINVEPARGTETILLVEDEEGVRRLLKHALSRQGYTVLEAADGETALSVFERNSDSIQLLLTDLLMPGMNGRELAQRLISQRQDLKVIYISGYSDDILLRSGALYRGMSFLQKPLKPEVLAAKLREVLDTPARPGANTSV